MTETDKLIQQLEKERPGFKERVEYYSEQLDYAALIMDFRKGLGLTQQQLADKIGVPQSTIARWESGQGNITIKNLAKIGAVDNKKLVLAFK